MHDIHESVHTLYGIKLTSSINDNDNICQNRNEIVCKYIGTYKM